MNGQKYTDIKTFTIDKSDDHQWNDGVVTTPATCTEAGVKTYTCTVCKVTKTEEIPATDHTYSAPTFNWSEDYKTCTAAISCKNGDDTQTLNCTVSVKNTAATCTVNGSDVYTATIVFNGETYTDTKTVSVPATGHSYGEPTFNWSDDCSSCTATFKCTAGDDTKTVDAAVEDLGGGVNINYAATVTFNGNTYTDTATKVRFIDVPKDQYYYDAVDWAAENGITAGITPTTFSPNGTCTRSQVVRFLWNAAGQPEPSADTPTFSDVKPSAWYYTAVQWAIQENITAGTGNNMFSPDAACTRAQVVMFLWNAAGQPEPSANTPTFSDVNNSAWYGKAVRWAAENGVTVGTGNNQFSPNKACTRAEIVTLLYNYMGK